MKRAPAILTLVVISAFFAYGFLRAGQVGWQRLQDYPGTGVTTAGPGQGRVPALPDPGAEAPRAPRVLLILMDGVSARDGIRLPTLVQLADTGAAYTLRVPVPAWPAPSWSTLFTGRSPAAHGVLLASESSPPAGEHLLSVLAGSGLQVALVAEEPLLRLFGSAAGAGQFTVPTGWEGTGAPLLEATDQALATGADLVVVHLGGLHTVAHRLAAAAGGEEPPAPAATQPAAATPTAATPTTAAESDATGAAAAPPMPRVVPWDEALGWTDARLALLLARIDRSKTTVVAVGTYGAAPTGEHGSGHLTTPLVISGPLAARARGQADLRDVAPTLAALLGIPYQAEGAVLADALAPELVPAAQGGPAGAPASGLDPLRHYWAAIQPHLWPALAVLLLGGGYLWLSLRQRFGRLLLAAMVLYLILHYLSLLALGFRFRPDLPGLEEPGWPVLRDIALAVAAGMLPAAFLVGLAAGHRGRKPDHSALLGIHLGLCLMVLVALSELPVVIYTGWTDPVRWPGHFLAIRFFADMAQGVVLGLASPLWATATASGAALGSLLWPAPRDPKPELRVVAGSDWSPTRPRPSGRAPRATGASRSTRTGGRRR